MQSWADHCSSDDDSDDGHPARLQTTVEDDEDDLSYDEHGAASGDALDDDLEEDEEYPPAPRPLDLASFSDPRNLPEGAPTQAPYTAHIGNLAFNITEAGELAFKIEEMVKDRYQNKHVVKVTEARLGIDRETGKRKGFGYVEFETVEELMILLNLNDGCSEINKRRIRLDIAQPPRNQQRNHRSRNNDRNNNRNYDRNNNRGGDIDGSKFRGGKFTQRQTPAERPGLKLAPRSKPVGETGGGSESNIFGNAKPRSGDWRSNRSVEERNGGDKNGGGERGGGRQPRRNSRNDGRGGRRGGGQQHAKRGSRTEKNVKKEKAPPAPAPLPVAKETKKATKVANSFSAFLDSDSD